MKPRRPESVRDATTDEIGVDEINLLTFPVVVGQGTRLFLDTSPDMALELVESRATRSGVMIQVYRPNGRPQRTAANGPVVIWRTTPGGPLRGAAAAPVVDTQRVTARRVRSGISVSRRRPRC